MAFRLRGTTTWFDTDDGLAVLTKSDALVFESDDAVVIREFLELLRQPRERAELVAEFGEGPAEELLSALEDAGVLEETGATLQPRSTTVAAAMISGCSVIARPDGVGADLADGVVRALADWGVEASHRPMREALKAEGLVLGCYPSLYDAELLDANILALASNALYLPVIVDGDDALIGPFVTGDAPCSRCVSLRRFAFKPQALHSAWYHAQGVGAVASAGLDVRRIPAIAGAVASFLKNVDDALTLDGKKHPLLRVAADGLQDVRRVMRHSHCLACGPRPRSSSEPNAASLVGQRDEVRDHWRAILAPGGDPEGMRPVPAIEEMYRDPVTGILEHGEDWDNRAGYFRNLPECWGGLALARERDWVTTGKQGINGTGPNLEHLRLVMLSEGLERYGQYSHRPALEKVAYEEVRLHAFDPRELTLYNEEQYAHKDFPRPRFTESHKLNWSWGYNLHTEETKLFPSEVITVNLSDETYPERILEQRLTTGGASHVSYTRALHNAMRELIERDQLMIAWYKRIRLPRVELPEATGDPYVDGLLEFLREAGVKMHAFDMRLDFKIPGFLILGTVEDRVGDIWPNGTFGAAAADLDPTVALGRALGEMRIHYETLALTPNDMKDYRQNPYDVDDMTAGWGVWWPNYMWHLNPANRRAFDFLFDHTLTTRFEDIEGFATGDPVEERQVLLDQYRKVGLSPWVWDVGNEETSHSGFRIVKLEVPGICHLVPGRQSRRLACRRFEQVALDMGRPCLPPGEQNPDPHIQA